MRTLSLFMKPLFTPSKPTADKAPFSKAAFKPEEASAPLKSARLSAWAWRTQAAKVMKPIRLWAWN